MRPEGLERYSWGSGPLHRLDARLKLIAAIFLVVAVIATPIGAWRVFGALGLVLVFLIGLAGTPPRELARRWLGLFLVVGFLAFMVAPAHPARERHGLAVVASSIVVKNGLALLTILVLASVTPFPKLLRRCASWVCLAFLSRRSSSWTAIGMSSSKSSTGWPLLDVLAHFTAPRLFPGA